MATGWGEPCAAVSPAKILNGTLRQHATRVIDPQVVLIAAALGQPRLWEYLVRGALDGFEEGFARPHDGRMSTRLHQGALVGQQALRRRVESLIERRPSDVALLALAQEDDVLHVLSAGTLSVYLYQSGTLRQVGATDDQADGLLKLTPSWTTETVAPGDLVIAGSPSAVSDAALHELHNLLVTGVAVPPRRIVERLQHAALERGAASVAVAVRIR
jgi:hypothetical protein